MAPITKKSEMSYFKTFPMSMNKFFQSDYWYGIATSISGWITSFIAPVGPFLVLVFTLVVFDIYTGRKAAIKRGEKVTSRGYKRTVEKILLYTAAILASEGMAYVFKFIDPVTYVTAFVIALTEYKSIIENVEQVTGANVWTAIKDKLTIFKTNGTKN